MKKLLLAAALLSGLNGFSQVGKDFPALTGETLDGKSVTVPESVKGKYSLIAVAYSSDAETDLSSWLNPIYNKFIAKTGLMDEAYDVNLYFIPMFTAGNIAFVNKAKKAMKEESDPELHPFVLFYKGDIDTYKTELKLQKKDTPYLFLLDKTGKIVHTVSGGFSDAKLEAIEDKIE